MQKKHEITPFFRCKNTYHISMATCKIGLICPGRTWVKNNCIMATGTQIYLLQRDLYSSFRVSLKIHCANRYQHKTIIFPNTWLSYKYLKSILDSSEVYVVKLPIFQSSVSWPSGHLAQEWPKDYARRSLMDLKRWRSKILVVGFWVECHKCHSVPCSICQQKITCQSVRNSRMLTFGRKTYVVFQEICLSNILKQIKSRANYTVPGANLTVEPWEVRSFWWRNSTYRNQVIHGWIRLVLQVLETS